MLLVLLLQASLGELDGRVGLVGRPLRLLETALVRGACSRRVRQTEGLALGRAEHGRLVLLVLLLLLLLLLPVLGRGRQGRLLEGIRVSYDCLVNIISRE
jgi:hypothetical protein